MEHQNTHRYNLSFDKNVTKRKVNPPRADRFPVTRFIVIVDDKRNSLTAPTETEAKFVINTINLRTTTKIRFLNHKLEETERKKGTCKTKTFGLH